MTDATEKQNDILSYAVICNDCDGYGPPAMFYVSPDRESLDLSELRDKARAMALAEGYIADGDSMICKVCQRTRDLNQGPDMPSLDEVLSGASVVCRELLASGDEPTTAQLRKVAQAVLRDIERIGGS